MPSIPTTTASGAIVSPDSGQRHIPASVRPDGTKRKEIKIRPGYKPPEDVEVYKNRTANAFKNRGTGGIPGADGLKEAKELGESSAASEKNKKRREARKKAAAEGKKDEDAAMEKKDWREGQKPVDELIDPEAERERKVRNIKKKLKQARELKEKKEGGAALLPEQFAKVIKMNELIRELDALGFDAEGEPKNKDAEGESMAQEGK